MKAAVQDWDAVNVLARARAIAGGAQPAFPDEDLQVALRAWLEIHRVRHWPSSYDLLLSGVSREAVDEVRAHLQAFPMPREQFESKDTLAAAQQYQFRRPVEAGGDDEDQHGPWHAFLEDDEKDNACFYVMRDKEEGSRELVSKLSPKQMSADHGLENKRLAEAEEVARKRNRELAGQSAANADTRGDGVAPTGAEETEDGLGLLLDEYISSVGFMRRMEFRQLLGDDKFASAARQAIGECGQAVAFAALEEDDERFEKLVYPILVTMRAGRHPAIEAMMRYYFVDNARTVVRISFGDSAGMIERAVQRLAKLASGVEEPA